MTAARGPAPAAPGLAQASVLIAASMAVLQLSMVVYHHQMSLRLGEDYSELYTLTGLVNIAVVVASGATTWLTRTFAHEAALRGERSALRLLGRLSPRLLAGLLGLGALLAAAAWPLCAWLHLDPRHYAWAAAAALSGLLLMVARAFLQGLHRFGLLGANYLLEALGRCTLPALLAAAWGVSGAFAGVAALALLAALAAAGLKPRPGAAEYGGAEAAKGGLGWDTAALALFSLMSFLDALMFKHAWDALDPELVGRYSRAALVGKSLLYASAALTVVALPAFSAALARGQDSRPLLRRFLLAMAGIELAALAALWAFTPLVLKLVVGALPAAELEAIAPLARALGLAAAPLALFQLVLLHGLAQRRRGLVPLLLAVAAAYGAVLKFWASSPLDYAACLAASSALLLAGGLWLSLRHPHE